MAGAVSRREPLSERQQEVLRATVTAYVGAAAPVGSRTLAEVLPKRVSSATIRAILAELSERGLVEQPHTSAGRIPTEEGLRVFIDELLDTREVPDHDRRSIAYQVGEAEFASLAPVAADLLSRNTHQLGFVAVPSFHRVVLQHVSLVTLSSDRILVLLVSAAGDTYRRVVRSKRVFSQPQLDLAAGMLNERVMGRTLGEVRDALAREADELRDRADRLLAEAVALGREALDVDDAAGAELVVATHLALLDQPEFQDPRRVRELFEAVETKVRLIEVLDRVLDNREVSVLLGGEVEEPALRSCALVACPYGSGDRPQGILGVIGPNRMDYARVIPMVDYLSRVLSDKLNA